MAARGGLIQGPTSEHTGLQRLQVHYDYVSPFITVSDCSGLLSRSGMHLRQDVK